MLYISVILKEALCQEPVISVPPHAFHASNVPFPMLHGFFPFFELLAMRSLHRLQNFIFAEGWHLELHDLKPFQT